MYAVIRDRSRQFLVKAGDTIQIDLRDDAKEGAEIVFDEVLFVGGDAKKTAAGAPAISGAKVTGKIQSSRVQGDKLKVVKWKRRKGSQMTKGHRQRYTEVKITDIKV